MNAPATTTAVTYDIRTSVDAGVISVDGETFTVSATYLGRTGCACGCRGSHSSTRRTRRSRIQRFTEMLIQMSEAPEDIKLDATMPDVYVAITNYETNSTVILYTDGRTS